MSADDEPTEEELREAAELARALERGTASEALPEDAFAAAGLVAYAKTEGELEPGRADAILSELLPKVQTREGTAARPRSWLRWLVPSLAAVAGVAIALNVALAPTETAALPPPDAALLAAQARALSGVAADRAEYARALSAYRTAMLAAVERRYEP